MNSEYKKIADVFLIISILLILVLLVTGVGFKFLLVLAVMNLAYYIANIVVAIKKSDEKWMRTHIIGGGLYLISVVLALYLLWSRGVINL